MKYGVELPIVGSYYVEVEARTPAEAIEKALAQQWDDENITEIYTTKEVCTGNVCHAPISAAGTNEIK